MNCLSASCAIEQDKGAGFLVIILQDFFKWNLRRALPIIFLNISQENQELIRVSPENGPQILTVMEFDVSQRFSWLKRKTEKVVAAF